MPIPGTAHSAVAAEPPCIPHDAYRKKTLDEEAAAIDFLDALDALGRAEFSKRLEREIRI